MPFQQRTAMTLVVVPDFVRASSEGSNLEKFDLLTGGNVNACALGSDGEIFHSTGRGNNAVQSCMWWHVRACVRLLIQQDFR